MVHNSAAEVGCVNNLWWSCLYIVVVVVDVAVFCSCFGGDGCGTGNYGVVVGAGIQ